MDVIMLVGKHVQVPLSEDIKKATREEFAKKGADPAMVPKQEKFSSLYKENVC